MKAIKREDLSLIDFSDITGRGRLLDIHPGEILNEDFLGPACRNTGLPKRSASRHAVSMKSCMVSALFPRIRLCGWRVSSARPLNSGSTCKRNMICAKQRS